MTGQTVNGARECEPATTYDTGSQEPAFLLGGEGRGAWRRRQLGEQRGLLRPLEQPLLQHLGGACNACNTQCRVPVLAIFACGAGQE